MAFEMRLATIASECCNLSSITQVLHMLLSDSEAPIKKHFPQQHPPAPYISSVCNAAMKRRSRFRQFWRSVEISANKLVPFGRGRGLLGMYNGMTEIDHLGRPIFCSTSNICIYQNIAAFDVAVDDTASV
jgi:hypothetical protein